MYGFAKLVCALNDSLKYHARVPDHKFDTVRHEVFFSLECPAENLDSYEIARGQSHLRIALQDI